MPILAVLAILGASLGQPDDPPDQDIPAAEQQDTDADLQPAPDEQAEQPDANTDSDPADEQQAEQQQADSDSSSAGEQPGETGGDDASAGLDEATGWRAGSVSWFNWTRTFVNTFVNGAYRTYGPFTIEGVHRHQPVLEVDVTVQGSRSPEQWGVVEDQAREWMCALDGREFIHFGGILVLNLRDEAGESRTVRITACEPGPQLAR